MRARVWCSAVPFVLAAVAATGVGATPRAVSGSIVFAADRNPTLYGEIYRVDRNGRRVDLSRSPARDLAPAVSPDGRLVAFSSNRGGKLALYTVHLDGTHLKRVSPFLASGVDALDGPSALAWSPGGGRLLALVAGTTRSQLWVGTASGGGRVLVRSDLRDAAWAPGGHELAWVDGADVLTVASPSGKRLWEGVGTALAWSATGRLAVTARRPEVRVYDAAGRKLTTLAAGAFAWSPDGSELATLSGKDLRRLQVRRGGVGRPFVDARVAARNGSLQWLGDARLRISTGVGWIGYDVAHRRPWKLPPGFAAFSYGAASRSGDAVAVTTYAKTGRAGLAVASAGGPGRALASAPPCGDDTPFASLQFTPDGRSLVYQDDCFSPPADLWSIRPDGTGLRRVASTSSDETEPSVSPDRARIAYGEQDVGECKGCTHTIWEMHADGSGRQALTTQTDKNSLWDDSAPSFSPDGATIVFSRWSGGDSVDLVEIPAGGGAQRTLPVQGSGPAWGPARIAFVTTKSQVETVLPDGSERVVVARDVRVVGGSLAWSGDGRLAWLDSRARGGLALSTWSGSRVVSAPLAPLRMPYRGAGVAWSPDGTRIAVTACDEALVCDLWTVAPDGSGLRRLTHGLGAIGRLSWPG